ncbi:MAG: 2Fe-2S iron-sulfur cluster-binding protein [Bacteroidetes bacterium]|nr:2Fe-2S iron-sulfur cluster-binding protein [Bacteroidota bacterium]
MITLTIDHIVVQVPEGVTVMQAAGSIGTEIPSMCYLPGHFNHPSCMVCMVRDAQSGKFFPSCAMPVSEGMQVITHSPEIREMRRESLELLLSDHAGDCEAPCRLSCPAFMNIPLMNRLIASSDFEQALQVVQEEIALPLLLGYICPAPCEKACRRKPLQGSVSICLLKRTTATVTKSREKIAEALIRPSGKKVAVIGTGPAGLAAAFYLLRAGHQCVLFDKNDQAGGSLRYDIPESRLPREILDAEIRVIQQMGAVFEMNRTITGEAFEDLVKEFDAVILASGERSQQPSGFPAINTHTMGTSRPGIFGCGAIVRPTGMAVRSAAQGRVAALETDIYLKSGKHKKSGITFHSVITHLFESELQEYLKESIPGPRTEPQSGFLAGFSAEEAVREAKRCLRCDCRKSSGCKLRILSDEYQANRKRFTGPERKRLTKSMQHDLVVYEPQKCIRCGLCIEIAGKEKQALGLTFVGHGFEVEIGVPFNQTIKEALILTALECATSCPTGALAVKELTIDN